MGARARDRQKRAGARSRARDAGRAARGREQGDSGSRGHAEGPQRIREDLGQAEVWLPRRGTPRCAEGWRCLLPGQEQQPFDWPQPFLPWAPHSCGELNCTAGGPSQQKGNPAPQGSPRDKRILYIKCFTVGEKKKEETPRYDPLNSFHEQQ